jgi:dephospho-CoA kinase
MKIIAITGGVASGKNYICDIFKKFGAEIFDADSQVHDLLKYNSQIISEVAKNFPSSLKNQQIDREILGKIVFENSEIGKKNLKTLEQIIHPQIKINYDEFIKNNLQNNQKFVLLNIPLILESQGKNQYYNYDYLVAIKCHIIIRKNRFIARQFKKNPQNFDYQQNLARFNKIVSLQLKDEERFAMANFIINNNSDLDFLQKQIEQILKDL